MPYALTPTPSIRAYSLSRRPFAKRHVVERPDDEGMIGQAFKDFVDLRKQEYAKPPPEDDPDALFLRSLLPNLKALPDQEKAEAKLEIMQVLCRRQFGGVRHLQQDSPWTFTGLMNSSQTYYNF